MELLLEISGPKNYLILGEMLQARQFVDIDEKVLANQQELS